MHRPSYPYYPSQDYLTKPRTACRKINSIYVRLEDIHFLEDWQILAHKPEKNILGIFFLFRKENVLTIPWKLSWYGLVRLFALIPPRPSASYRLTIELDGLHIFINPIQL